MGVNEAQAHAAVVDEFRNKNKGESFLLLSASVDGSGVHVISAVSESLQGRVKAPEIMKRLGLRGGGRADFAQGGGVAAEGVEALRKQAHDLMRKLAEGTGV